MAQSSGSNAYVAFIAETVYGVTPATPELVGIPLNTFNVNLTKDNQKDASIQSDGQSRYISFGNQSVSGDVEDSLTTLHAPFLESMMRSAFATNVLVMGNTAKTFTMEQGFPSTSIYRSFTGVDVDKATITVPIAGDCTIKYTVMGKGMTVAASTIDNSAGITVPAVTRPMRHNGGTVTEGGSAIAYITQITLNVDSGLAQNFVLGSNTIRDTTAGPRKVNGSFTALFESAAIMNKFIAGTQTSFAFTVSDGTNTYNFNCPNVNYTAATVSVASGATIPVNVTFDANYDLTAGSTLVITKA